MNPTPRPSGRALDQLRPVSIERHYTRHAEGSVLVSFGDTRVLCTASVEDRVPGFLRGKGEGWITAEYGMLPRATKERSQREAARGGQGGRTMEIQRLIGRSLRACIDRAALGERTITLDCDVLQADGGTRCAAVTGAYVALVDAVRSIQKRQPLKREPIHGAVAAVSVGIWRGQAVLDLDYAEDVNCDTDMNVIMNDGGGFIELQGTAEGHALRREELDALLALAGTGIADLIALQRAALADWSGPMRRVVLASGNAGKLAEIGALLAGRALELLPQGALGIADIEETGLTFVENALLKARHAARQSGLAALADDSGLCVDALDGAPGLHSARYAGGHGDSAANIAKLLAALDGQPTDTRTAHFYCVIVLLRTPNDPAPLIAEGRWHGRILTAARGAQGFGYDPVFLDPGLERSAAELDPGVKNRISHRGQALAQLLRLLDANAA